MFPRLFGPPRPLTPETLQAKKEHAMSYAMEYPIAARAGESARAAFIRRTYAHLAGAILAFVGLEVLLFKWVDSLIAEGKLQNLAFSPVLLIVLLVAFIGVGFLARAWAYSAVSRPIQYIGLGLYVVLQAVIFLPMLYYAQNILGDTS